jgi:hypothetical protein
MSEDNKDQEAQKAVENRDQAPIPAATASGSQPAGPHAEDRLTDPEKTPGTGSLANEDGDDADVGPD